MNNIVEMLKKKISEMNMSELLEHALEIRKNLADSKYSFAVGEKEEILAELLCIACEIHASLTDPSYTFAAGEKEVMAKELFRIADIICQDKNAASADRQTAGKFRQTASKTIDKLAKVESGRKRAASARILPGAILRAYGATHMPERIGG